MYRYGRGIRFLSYTSTIKKAMWDPTVSLELNHPTLTMLEKCSTRDHFKQILGQMFRASLIGQTFPMSRLILFSSVSYLDNLGMAILLFSHFTPCPNLYIYNTMISAVSFSSHQTFGFYNSMLGSCIWPDKHTLLNLLKSARYVSEAKQIHCHGIVMGLVTYNYFQNSLLKMYMEKGEMVLAHKLFLCRETPDLASFNIMISGYAKKGYALEAIGIFYEMLSYNLQPDEFTILGLLVCCGQLVHLQLGKSVHAWMERRKDISSLNLILGNALLDMYVKCNGMELAKTTFDSLMVKDVVSWNTMIAGFAKVGDMDSARTIFDKMPSKDLVSWNSLIAGYAQICDYMMVGELFGKMVEENVLPDNVTMVNLISVATEAGALDLGRSMHGVILRRGMKIDVILGSALIDMYSKCGSIERALNVFRDITEKDVTLWTTMITGFSFHGYGIKALELFSEMVEKAKPNKVTILAVLTGCSHSGLVNEGLNLFNTMKEDYDIEPGIEHYGCIVDLLGRSGRLTEAVDLIRKMPMKPSRSIWGAMLSACREYQNLEMAEMALEELLKLEPEKEGGYILLSNIYAANEKWRHSDKIREIMESRGVKKTAGCSSVVVDGVVHDFVAADKWHPRWLDMEILLQCLSCEMKLGSEFEMDLLLLLMEIELKV